MTNQEQALSKDNIQNNLHHYERVIIYSFVECGDKHCRL